MKLTNTTPICRVKIGSLYQRPPSEVSLVGYSWANTLLPSGRKMDRPRRFLEPQEPPVWKQVLWGLGIVGAFLATYGIGYML